MKSFCSCLKCCNENIKTGVSQLVHHSVWLSMSAVFTLVNSSAKSLLKSVSMSMLQKISSWTILRAPAVRGKKQSNLATKFSNKTQAKITFGIQAVLLAFEHSGIVQHQSADETRLLVVWVFLQSHQTKGLPESNCTGKIKQTSLNNSAGCKKVQVQTAESVLKVAKDVTPNWSTWVANDLLEPRAKTQSKCLMSHHGSVEDLHTQRLQGNLLRVGLQKHIKTHSEIRLCNDCKSVNDASSICSNQ